MVAHTTQNVQACVTTAWQRVSQRHVRTQDEWHSLSRLTWSTTGIPASASGSSSARHTSILCVRLPRQHLAATWITVSGRNSGGTSVRNAAIVSCAAAIAVDVALGGPAATGPWNMSKGRSGVGRSSGGRSATVPSWPTSTTIRHVNNISTTEMTRAASCKSVSEAGRGRYA